LSQRHLPHRRRKARKLILGVTPGYSTAFQQGEFCGIDSLKDDGMSKDNL